MLRIICTKIIFRVKLHKLKYGTEPNFTDLKAPIFDDIGKIFYILSFAFEVVGNQSSYIVHRILIDIFFKLVIVVKIMRMFNIRIP